MLPHDLLKAGLVKDIRVFFFVTNDTKVKLFLDIVLISVI